WNLFDFPAAEMENKFRRPRKEPFPTDFVAHLNALSRIVGAGKGTSLHTILTPRLQIMPLGQSVAQISLLSQHDRISIHLLKLFPHLPRLTSATVNRQNEESYRGHYSKQQEKSSREGRLTSTPSIKRSHTLLTYS